MSVDRPAADASLCARAVAAPPSVSHPLAPAIYLSSVYEVADLNQIDELYEGRVEGYFYARDGHPNASLLAGKLAAIERAEAGLVCTSGMAAIAASLLAMVGQGDHVLLSDGLYGKTTSLVTKELARFGISHDTFDASRPEALKGRVTPRTRVILAETISNPLLRVTDLETLGEIARETRVALVVDHTFAPLLCRPIELGATLVVHSLTKLIGGHSDLTLGFVAGRSDLVDTIRSVASTFGQTGNPFESWLALRGLSTLSLRCERTSANALGLASRLEEHSRVIRAIYPGLPSHPDHDTARRMLNGGFGAMVAFDVGDRQRADRFIRALRHIPFAPSLGDVQTTLSHPCSTSHRGLDPVLLDRLGITPGLIRLSVGLEDLEDLWADLERGLAAIDS